MAFTIEVLFTDFAAFRLFLATGISGPLSLSACAYALRKFCEDASAIIYEPSNLEILLWIGEVMIVSSNFFPYYLYLYCLGMKIVNAQFSI